jgi:hypothetical protein
LVAFIKPVMAGYNPSSLILGSNQSLFYSPVSFVFRPVSWTCQPLYVTFASVEPGLRPGQANSRAKTEQEKDSSRKTRDSGYRGLVSYCR